MGISQKIAEFAYFDHVSMLLLTVFCFHDDLKLHGTQESGYVEAVEISKFGLVWPVLYAIIHHF